MRESVKEKGGEKSFKWINKNNRLFTYLDKINKIIFDDVENKN